MFVFGRAWQVALDQARAVRMASNAGMPAVPPPYGATTYVQAYPGPNGGYYGPHPPPYGKEILTLFVSKLARLCTFHISALEHYRHLTRTKLYCLVMEAYRCNSLLKTTAQWCPDRTQTHNL